MLKTPIVNQEDWSSFKLNACLFDVDGTLTDTMPLYDEIISIELRKYGVEITSENKIKIFSGILEGYSAKPPGKYFYLKLIYSAGRRSSLGRLKALQFTKRVITQMSTVPERAPLFPDVPEILSFLIKKGIRIGAVSMASTEGVQRRLERFDLLSSFEVIIGRDQVKVQKPDPQGYLKAANALGVDSKDCLVIGDLPLDSEAGKRAGMRTVGVLTGVPVPEYIIGAKPDLVVKNLGELKLWLEKYYYV